MRLFHSARRPTARARVRNPRLRLEILEDRTLLSGLDFVKPTHVIRHPAGMVAPFGTPGPTGTIPSQILHAYGFDRISLPGGVTADGSGTTIAIVDAFDDPTIAHDLRQFDAQFQLPDPTFTKVNQSGGTALPPPDSGWASEIALDVQWSHAIAPGAKILLVEANDNSLNNLLNAVIYAARQPGVVAVSMSWGGGEWGGETSLDSVFRTPIGHSGVTFVASSGDSGAPPGYPAISPNVLAVGGTTLNVDGQGNYGSESGWGGSGGGISAFEPQPAYQRGVVTQSSFYRTNPDVSYDSDPYTGFPVYDSFNNGSFDPWSQFGGTSDAAPQWSALIAIADQGRALAGKGALDGRTQTLPLLYQVSPADFHDITTGASFGWPYYPAGPGYDLVTGRGTPVANKLVADLIGNPVATAVTHFSISALPGSAAGAAFSVSVTALDQNNKPVTGYGGTVHFTSSDGSATLPANYTFKAADNGAHTFTNGVTLTKAGSDTVTVSDAALSSITGSATVLVTAANPNHLGFGQQPTNAAAGSAITPAVTVQVFDLYNNLVTSDNTDSVAVALGTNPGSGTLSGTTTATVSNGIATFSNLSINKTGNGYTLKVSPGSLGTATSATFNITPGSASQLAFGQQPTNTPAGSAITPAVTVQVLDAQGNLVTSDNSDAVTMALNANAGGGSLSGTLTGTAQNGVATFSNLAVSKGGTGYTLVASSGSLTASTSSAFNVTLPGTHLFFSQQPTDGAAGSAISPAVVVQVLDANNSLVATDNSDTITLVFGANPGSGTLSGTTAVTVSAGVATFGNLSINKTGTGYTLKASSGNLTGKTSSSFNVTPGTATHLGFAQQPTSTAAGTAVSPAVTVQVLDANNNVVTTDQGDSITVAISSNPGGGTLSGTNPVTVTNGMATFANLSIGKTGTGYTLTANSGSLASATSNTFNITPGNADHLAFVQQPTSTTVGSTIAPAVTVQVLDANNNLVTGDSTDVVTLTLASNPSGATLGGTNPVTVSGGVATFSNLSVSLVGSGYTLGASSGSLVAATSGSFNVTVASTVIEDFEHGLGLYHATGFFTPARTATYAAHDGSYGLDVPSSWGWIYRNDSAAQLQQGETISVWVQVASISAGRAYFGFGASATGTLSVVLAADSGQLIIQDNSGYRFTDLAATPQSYVPSHWYRLEVAWGTGGAITGRLYDSNGTTLLKSVQATDNNITAGGIAFLATSYDKYFDTVTMTPTGSPHSGRLGGGGAAGSAAQGKPAAAESILAFMTLPAPSFSWLSTPVAVSSPALSASVPAMENTAARLAPVSQESGVGSDTAVQTSHQTQADADSERTEIVLWAPQERHATDAYFASRDVFGS